MEERLNFSCSDDGCNKRFSSENQLRCHKKKHEMMLSFGKQVVNNCTDETPTPVRFLRDCEAVGIFQDLSKNPFEETFRKAAEAVSSANQRDSNLSFSSSLSTDDTLHTPHVFPLNLPEEDSRSRTPCLSEPMEDEDEAQGRSDMRRVVKQEADTSILTSTPPTPLHSIRRPGIDVNTVAPLVPVDNNFGVLVSKPAVQPNEVQLCLKVSHGTTLELAGNTLKILGSQDQNCQPNSNIILDSGDLRTVIFTSQSVVPQGQPSNNVKQKLKNFLGNSKIKKTPGQPRKPIARVDEKSDKVPKKIDNVPIAPNDSSLDEKRQLLRAKNRAAAMRCRERRKAWVAELGKRADEMYVTNRALVQEVSLLRAEVARLKALLLAHRDCPVTLAAQGVTPSVVDLRVEPVLSKEEKRRGGRSLSLDIESAMSHSSQQSIDLPSPLIRRDEILTSVVPTTPSDLPHHLETDGEILGERALATPVIQLNPNAKGKDHGYR